MGLILKIWAEHQHSLPSSPLRSFSFSMRALRSSKVKVKRQTGWIRAETLSPSLPPSLHPICMPSPWPLRSSGHWLIQTEGASDLPWLQHHPRIEPPETVRQSGHLVSLSTWTYLINCYQETCPSSKLNETFKDISYVMTKCLCNEKNFERRQRTNLTFRLRLGNVIHFSSSWTVTRLHLLTGWQSFVI